MSTQDKDLYNKGGMFVFLASMVFCLGFFAIVTFGLPGIDLKEVKPVDPNATQLLAKDEKTIDMATVTEPWLEKPEIAAYGKKLYVTNCSVCHGNAGLGDGPGGGSLNPKPRNLVEGKWVKGGDSLGLMDVLQNGLGAGSAMVAFAHLPVKDRWAIVQFMRSITKNKVPDDEAKLKQIGPTLK